MTNRELREKRAKLIADAQVILRNDKRTSEDVVNANKMLDDADVIKSEYEAVERADAMDAELRSTRPISQPQPGVILDSPEVRSASENEAFRTVFTGGSLTKEQRSTLRFYNRTTNNVERRDMGQGTSGGDTGGLLIPVGYQKEIEMAEKSYGQMLTVLRQWNTDSGQPIQYPLGNDVNSKAFEITAGTPVTEADITLSQVTFNVSTYSTGLVKADLALVNDSAFPLGQFIADQFGMRRARGLNHDVTLGSTSGNVQGIVGAATLGATSAAPTAITYTDLVNLYGSLDPAYIGNSTFSFNNSVFRQLLALEDTLGRPIFAPSISSKFPDTLLGRPFVQNADMVSPAAGTSSVLFGDFSKYLLRNAGGYEMFVLKERFADQYQIGYVMYFRSSGKLLDAGTHPVVKLTQHA